MKMTHIMERRRINIAYPYEVKRKEDKAKQLIDDIKLYTEKNNARIYTTTVYTFSYEIFRRKKST